MILGFVAARGEATNKKNAEKTAALDACVKLAQLGRLAHVPKPATRGGGGAGGRGESKKGAAFAGDVGAVPLCSSQEEMEGLCRIAETLVEVPTKPIEPLAPRYDDADDDMHVRPVDRAEVETWNRRHMQLQRLRRCSTAELSCIATVVRERLLTMLSG